MQLLHNLIIFKLEMQICIIGIIPIKIIHSTLCDGAFSNYLKLNLYLLLLCAILDQHLLLLFHWFLLLLLGYHLTICYQVLSN